jgi:hypothetical protein
MAAVLKTAMGGDTHRGFESHALRCYQHESPSGLRERGREGLRIAGLAISLGPTDTRSD